MTLATQRQIDHIFNDCWGLYRADIERVLNALSGNSSGSNNASAMLVLSAVEQFAKLYSPTSKRRGENNFKVVRINSDDYRDIQAKHSVKLFFRKYMAPIDPRYGIYGEWVWDVFRNGLTHLFFSKKIINVPLTEIDNSFLTGVHWPGTLSDLQVNSGLLTNARRENMSFTLAHYTNGIPRPGFIIIPHIFYLDLIQAATNFKHDVENVQHRKLMFTKGIRLLDRARRKPFIHVDLPQSTRKRMLREIRNLL